MKFYDFDKIMRKYEENIDQYIIDDMYIVARLDGRAFTKMTKRLKFEKPFDERFRDLMIETTMHLMKDSGFNIIYGYTQSDEISLLFHKYENSFCRKVRKLNTTLAGGASAYFTKLLLNKFNDKDISNFDVATFDCRVIPLPNIDRVVDYFNWRQEDSHRNSLNGWCYWTLRKEGMSKGNVTSKLNKQGNSFKNELLFQRGINYNELPNWQKRGTGLFFNTITREGLNPKTNEKTLVKRRDLVTDFNIPLGEEYSAYIKSILAYNYI